MDGRPPHAAREALIREKQSAAFGSMVSGLFLTALKLSVGLLTGSLGMMAEAIHSGLDFGAAAMTWGAVRASWRPPDAEHQYGHGKVENLAAFAETILLVLTSVWILREAALRLAGHGPEVRPSVAAFAVMAISIAVDVHRSRQLQRVARASGSQALEADALHFSTDIASSAVVILGLAGVALGDRLGVPWLHLADPVAAAVVALIVLFLSWSLGRRAVDMLLDRAPEGLRQTVEASLAGLPGLQGPPRVRVRMAGDQAFADVELPVARALPVAEATRLSAEAREQVRAVTGDHASVLVQLAPADVPASSLRRRVADAVAMEGLHAHNIAVLDDGMGLHADLHLELPDGLTLGEGHAVADRVEAAILREVPELGRVDIHLELHGDAPAPAGPLADAERLALEARIREAAAGQGTVGGLHDLVVARTEVGLYLSCHLTMPAHTPLAEAHAVTDRLEDALRAAVPELARVSVHAEPD